MTLCYIEKPNGKSYYCHIEYLKKPKDDAYHTSLDSENNTNESEPAQNDYTIQSLSNNNYSFGGLT